MIYVPCRKCKKASAILGYILEKDEDNRSWLRKCECLKKYQASAFLSIKMKEANLKSSMAEAAEPYNPLKDYKGHQSLDAMNKLVKYITEYDTDVFKNQSLYLYGPFNTQKTTLANWVGMNLIKKSKTVYYTMMRTLLNALVDVSYDEDNKPEQKEIIKNAREADYLILDESFDSNKLTMYKSGYQLPFLDEFIRTRMDIQERPVLFISNVPIDNITDSFPMFDSLKNLLIRKIQIKGAELTFMDDYLKCKDTFDIEDIFA